MCLMSPLRKLWLKDVRHSSSSSLPAADQRQILAADERKRVSRGEEERSLRVTLKRSATGCKPWHLMALKGNHFLPTLILWNTCDLPEQDERSRESTEQWREFHRQSVWGRKERGDAASRQDAEHPSSSTSSQHFKPCVNNTGLTGSGSHRLNCSLFESSRPKNTPWPKLPLPQTKP